MTDIIKLEKNAANIKLIEGKKNYYMLCIYDKNSNTTYMGEVCDSAIVSNDILNEPTLSVEAIRIKAENDLGLIGKTKNLSKFVDAQINAKKLVIMSKYLLNCKHTNKQELARFQVLTNCHFRFLEELKIKDDDKQM